jgi:hypothetical protein
MQKIFSIKKFPMWDYLVLKFQIGSIFVVFVLACTGGASAGPTWAMAPPAQEKNTHFL